MVNVQKVGKILDVFGAGLSLAVEKSGYNDFLTAKLLCNGLERQVLGLLCLEESGGGSG